MWMASCGGEPDLAREAVATPEVATSAEAEDSAAEVEIEWAGCFDETSRVCHLHRSATGHQLRFWSSRAEVPTLVEVDGRVVDVLGEDIDGGRLVRLQLADGDRRVEVRYGDRLLAAVDVMWHEESAAMKELGRLFAAKDFRGACAAVRQAPDLHLHPVEVIRQFHQRGGCRGALGVTPQRIAYAAAAELAAMHGLPMSHARAAMGLLALCSEDTKDEACAEYWIRRIEGTPRRESGVWVDYVKGVQHLRRGRWHDALAAARRAELWAARLGMLAEQVQAIELSVNALAEAGRVSDVDEATRRLLSASRELEDPCLRAAMMNNAAAARQVLLRSGVDLDPPIDWMDEAVDTYEQGKCTDHTDVMVARIGFVYALLSAGEVDEAERQFSEIRVRGSSRASAAYAEEIELLGLALALETNRWDRYAGDALLPVAENGGLQNAWYRSVLTAQALERFGFHAAALEEWSAAEAALDVENEAMPVSWGREYLTTSKLTSAVGLVEARLGLRDLPGALCAARRARSRAYSAVAGRGGRSAPPDIREFQAWVRARNAADAEAREDWRYSAREVERRRAARRVQADASLEAVLGRQREGGDDPCSGLRSPADGELIVVLLPAEDDTIVILEGRNRLRAFRAPAVPSGEPEVAAWAEKLASDIENELEASTAIRVLPVGRAWTARLHAVRFHGRYLGWEKAVSYGLDLPPLRGQADGRSAIVVADPSDDLPAARQEGLAVSATLQRKGWTVTEFNGADVRREPVLSSMAEADLFYYAGHGVRRGEDGWDSALLLGSSETVGVHDLLSAASMPRFAVLAGCETGAVSALLADGGMSIGRAMLVAGAESVLVGDDAVPDGETLVVMGAAFEAIDDLEHEGLAGLLLRALQDPEVRGLASESWSSFRVLVR